MVLNKLQKLRLGSRGSPLALIQAAMVRNMILQEYPRFESHIEIVPITTKGDQLQTGPLSEFGGKGLFTKEIDAALLDGRIDAAVHSMKDVESVLPEGLTVVSVLPREDPREFLLSPTNGGIADLPKGAVVGTSSPRRQAQLLNRRPDLRIVMFRGNIGTRLQKLSNGDVDATLLALAGLRRLGCSPVGSIIQPEEMLPSVAQGVIGIQICDDAPIIRDLFSGFCHTETYNCVTAERAMLAAFGGTCTTPIGALAICKGSEMCLRTKLFSGDGSKVFSVERKGSVDDAEFMGRDAGRELRRIMPTNLPASWL